MIVLEMEQCTPEWFAAKAGIPGASSFDKIFTKTGQVSKQRTDYLYQLAGERILGVCEETYSSPWMQRGKEMEDEWRDCFELVTGHTLKQVGLCYQDERKRCLCSPDSFVQGEKTGVEGKAPMMKTQVKYLLSGTLPTEYFCQVQGSMHVTGFEHWYFVSYYPGLPPLIIKVGRDDVWIAKFARALDEFCDELDDITERLRKAA